MKKLFFMMFFLGVVSFSVFSDADEREEVDFLLFLPNSAGQFVDQDRAMTQLDDMAKHLIKKNLSAGQISVYGYAANVANDIDSMGLSRDRALFVINELQKRGLSEELFADPVAYGSVDEWGDSADTQDRGLNRRVRILAEGAVLTPAIARAGEGAAEPVRFKQEEPPAEQEEAAEEAPSQIPWWLLLLLLLLLLALLAALLFLTFKRKKNEPAPQAAPLQKAAEPKAVPVKIRILGEEEIRFYSFGLYERRHGLNGDAVGDWFQAVNELTAYYEAQGYRVMLYWEVPGV